MLANDPNPATQRVDSELGRAEPHTRARNPSFRSSLFCVAVFCTAVLAVWPVVELATDDDFAYARMALAFARTGHFVFNGWETAMVGWQVIWGALLIRLFDYSFLTLRISTIILAAFLTFLFHRVLLRAGVSTQGATFGTLTLVLSPLFLPMAASFMTDIPALLCIVAAIYGCQRALRAGSDRAALAWLVGSAALNVVDGTVRQIAWLGALVIVPSAFWLLRRKRRFIGVALVTWLSSVAAILLITIWFSHQPHMLPEKIIRGPITPTVFWRIARLCIYGSLEVFCFCLPVLFAWAFELRALTRRRKLQILAFCAVASPLVLWAMHYNKIQGRLPPWSANVVSRYGILWSVPLMGDRPELLPSSVTAIIAILLLASLAGFVLWLRDNSRRSWFHSTENTQSIPASAMRTQEVSLYESAVLLVPFLIVYFLLLMPRAAFPSLFSDVFDRYYLPCIAAALILLLRLLRYESRLIPVSGYAVLLLFSFFSITGTHDVFAAYRAIARTRGQLQATGIRPLEISGPWEEDGGNQIDAQGFLNDPRLAGYRQTPHPPLEDCFYWFGPLVPALHPNYVLTVEKLKCLVPSQFRDVTYTTWLPPFRRTIYIERNPEPDP